MGQGVWLLEAACRILNELVVTALRHELLGVDVIVRLGVAQFTFVD